MLALKEAFEQCLRRNLRPVTVLASTRMWYAAAEPHTLLLAPLASARDGSLEYFVTKGTRKDRLRLLRAARAKPLDGLDSQRSSRQTSKGNRAP